MNNIHFAVPGEPRGKGRPRLNKKTGSIHTDSETRAYENKIIAFYHQAVKGFRFPDDMFLSVDVTAYLPIPKSYSKSKQAAMAADQIWPSRKPDTDNILKVVLDALNGEAYRDDARVIRCACEKHYGDPPRLEITVTGM